MGNNDSAGIRIEDFTGSVRIDIEDSSYINATNGYGIYISNCSNVTIVYSGNFSVDGTKGDIFINNSTVNNTYYESKTIVPATAISN